MKRMITLFALAALLISCGTGKHISAITAINAPKAIGPYSQAIKEGGIIYTSGQIGLSPVTNALAGDDITSQTRQVLDNLKAVLTEAGSDMSHVLKVTVYLKDLNDYSKVNEIYKDYFTDVRPARSAIQVARLPKDALIEMDCIAVQR